jgi:hypothetical protein
METTNSKLDLSSVLNAIMSLREHMDEKFQKIENTLKDHSQRLERIEVTMLHDLNHPYK